MKSSRTRSLLVCLWVVGVSPLFAASEVCRFTLPQAVEGRWDMEVVLFHRDGAFHHGFARVPRRDGVPHRVDVRPSRPIQWQTADGTPIEVPERMRGYYSYKLEGFREYKRRFEAGEMQVAHPIPTPPVGWKEGRLTGIVDVLIAPVNVANRTGRGPLDTAYRIRLDARGTMGGALAGEATWWTYEEKDDDYGADSKKTTVELENARWDPDYWKPAEGTSYARGTDWPQARGPMLDGSAADCQGPLVENLHDARLLWVGEEIIGGGRGAVLSRGGFAMYPYAWQNIGYGSFAGVTVADGKVLQYLTHPDEERVAADEAIARNVYVQLGADPRTMANSRGHLRDTVLCLDARTGATLWWFKSERTFGNVRSGKGGVGMTACFHEGRVYARGSGGLYCLDADTGELLWHKRGGRKGEAKAGYGPSGGWSHDESPVIVGGVLVMGHGGDEALAGIDPVDGSLLWTHSQVKGQNAVPTKVVLDGEDYIVVCSKETARLSLIDPSDGDILWRGDALGPNHASLAVWGDVVCGNRIDREKRKQGQAAAVRVSKDGAQRLWASDVAGYPPHRSVPVAHKGHFYIDDREGFFCLEADKGTLVNRQPHIYRMSWGSHNWVWTIAGNGRVLTSGVLMFSTADGGFQRMAGRLSLDLAGGYTCPIKPAMADGRLFCRLSDKLVCYDLRKDPEQRSQTIELTAPNAFASSTEEGDPVRLRVRVVNGHVTRASAHWPEVVGPEAQKIAEKWAAWYKKPLRWRSYPAPDLELDGEGLRGQVRLPMGWHFEHWRLALDRDGEVFSGTFTRSIPAVAEPLEVEGAVGGEAFEVEGGRCYAMTLEAAATQLHRSPERRTLTVVVVKGKGGVRGWAVAGRVNTMAHEVDPSRLAIGDEERLTGEVTVIFRDDAYFHLNPEAKTSVAATYRIDAAVKDGKIEGRHRGTLGHAWRREGKLAGRIGP
ncbi:MAG: PQQ-binding-like beta-propeller repeat protein [Candidatus Brocadiia bacterium]